MDAPLAVAAGFEEGLLLAAQVAGDRGAAAAAQALTPGLSARVIVAAAALDALSAPSLAEALRAIAAQLRAVSPERASRLAPRARSLLAADVPRSLGAAWLREAPAVRRGFAASVGVRAVVRAAAADAWRSADLELAARELGRGRALLARATEGLDADAATALVESLDAAEAAAVLALRALLGVSEGPADTMAAALLDAAQRAAPEQLVRALGAMALAVEGDGASGDVRSYAWRRIALEVAAVEGFVLAEMQDQQGDTTP